MFYNIKDPTVTIIFVIASLFVSPVYAGKQKHSKKRATQKEHQRKHDSSFCVTATPVIKKNVLDSLYQAVYNNKTQEAHTLLSLLPHTDEINRIKSHGLYRCSLLELAIDQGSYSIVRSIFQFPQPKDIDMQKAYSRALESGSHRMIKLFTRRSDIDPTTRDSFGTSMINKLAGLNKKWAEKLCQNLLIKKLKKERQDQKIGVCEPLTCMVCLQTPAEIYQEAQKNSPETQPQLKQLIEMTPCCHGLLCAQDKKQWLDTPEGNKNCPTCRKPL